MASTFAMGGAAAAGLAIFVGLYFGDPGKGLKGGMVTVAVVSLAAVALSLVR
jgi:hypothetical protein